MRTFNIHNQTCDEREFRVGDKEVKQIIPTYMYMCDTDYWCEQLIATSIPLSNRLFYFVALYDDWVDKICWLIYHQSFWWLTLTMIRNYGIIQHGYRNANYYVIYVHTHMFIWSLEYLGVSQDFCKIYIFWNYL